LVCPPDAPEHLHGRVHVVEGVLHRSELHQFHLVAVVIVQVRADADGEGERNENQGQEEGQRHLDGGTGLIVRNMRGGRSRRSRWRLLRRRQRRRDDDWRAHSEVEPRQLRREACGDGATLESIHQVGASHRTHSRYCDRHRESGEHHGVHRHAEAGHARGDPFRGRGTQIGLRRACHVVECSLGFQEHWDACWWWWWWVVVDEHRTVAAIGRRVADACCVAVGGRHSRVVRAQGATTLRHD